jgi:hypothetical protein
MPYIGSLASIRSHKVLLVAAQSAKLTGVKNRLTMRPFLRVVAVILLCVFLALLQTIDSLLRGRMSPLIRSGSVGAATILGWLLILTAGPFASVQLLRLRRVGLYATTILAGFWAYYFAGILFLRAHKRAVQSHCCSRRLRWSSYRCTRITRSSTLLYVSSSRSAIAVNKSRLHS